VVKDKPLIENKKFWTHHTIPGKYLPHDKNIKGFGLERGGALVYFSSKNEAISKGWKEDTEERKIWA